MKEKTIRAESLLDKQYTCPICGKEFTVVSRDYAYKDKSCNQVRYVCSWHCVVESERIKKQMNEERRRKRKERADARNTAPKAEYDRKSTQRRRTMTVTIPGYTTVTGQPLTILNIMKDARLFDADMDIEHYIEVIRQTASEQIGATLEANGNTLEERAESLLFSMAAHKMIIIEEVKAS